MIKEVGGYVVVGSCFLCSFSLSLCATNQCTPVVVSILFEVLFWWKIKRVGYNSWYSSIYLPFKTFSYIFLLFFCAESWSMLYLRWNKILVEVFLFIRLAPFLSGCALNWFDYRFVFRFFVLLFIVVLNTRKCRELVVFVVRIFFYYTFLKRQDTLTQVRLSMIIINMKVKYKKDIRIRK